MNAFRFPAGGSLMEFGLVAYHLSYSKSEQVRHVGGATFGMLLNLCCSFRGEITEEDWHAGGVGDVK